MRPCWKSKISSLLLNVCLLLVNTNRGNHVHINVILCRYFEIMVNRCAINYHHEIVISYEIKLLLLILFI